MKIETISFTVDGIKLVGAVYFPDTTSPPYPALCLCHGIPASAYNPTTEGYSLLAQKFAAAGFITLIFNFRGTGESEGNLDILGWSRDLTAALDILSSFKKVDKRQLTLIGFSAGAAVAVYVAARDSRVTSVITGACPADFSFLLQSQPAPELVQRFRSIGVIRDSDFPSSLTDWLQGFAEISPLCWISYISPRPLLLIHGEEDDIVPVGHARRLFELAREPKEMVIIPGLKHRLRLDQRAIDRALIWLKARPPSFPN